MTAKKAGKPSGGKATREASKPKTFNLHAAFEHLQTGLLHDLGASDLIDHPTTKGDNTELNWLKMLGGFLPKRYSVGRAFVVDVHNTISQQMDVVVYDRQYSPLLFQHEGGLYVPAESVYAVFEVKPELSKDYIEYAGEKIASVRNLHRTSASIMHAGGEYKPVVPKPIIGGLLAIRSSWKKPFGDSFRSSLAGLPENGRLDIGAGLKHGAFEVSADEHGDRALTVEEGEKALLFLAMRLLRQLQLVGTVAAIDIEAWGQVAFASP